MRKRWLSVVHELAKKDERVVFIGSDLSADPAIKKFQNEVPDRFFMEGVSEAHIIGMASGLAMSGKIVYVNTIATFLTRRCYEQNTIDLGLAKTNVRLFGSGGGLVYAPLGPTHLAIEDIAIMRVIPNMTVVVPCDAPEMQRAVEASVDYQGPIYFRVAKGGDPEVSRADLGFTIGKAVVYRDPGQAVIVTTGTMLGTALRACTELEGLGVKTGVIHVHTIKPFDQAGVLSALGGCRAVVTLEEHVVSGGLGSVVAELIAESELLGRVRFKRMGLPDFFPDTYGSQNSLLSLYGLDVKSVVETVRALASTS